MRSIDNYITNVKKLIELTEKQKIDWKKQNPTTVFFEPRTSAGERSVISLQKLENGLFYLQIDNKASKDVGVSINSMASPEMESLLKRLFEAAIYNIDRKNIEFFDDLINNI